MDIENKNVEQDEEVNTVNTEERDELKSAIEDTLSKIRRQSMLLGFQVACNTVLDKINTFERKPGSKSNNDHKRLIKDIKQFVEQGLSRKVNTDGETEIVKNPEE